jgi:hypothetical protein
VRLFVLARLLKTDAGLVDESYVDPGADITLARDIRLYLYHSFQDINRSRTNCQFTRDRAPNTTPAPRS